MYEALSSGWCKPLTLARSLPVAAPTPLLPRPKAPSALHSQKFKSCFACPCTPADAAGAGASGRRFQASPPHKEVVRKRMRARPRHTHSSRV